MNLKEIFDIIIRYKDIIISLDIPSNIKRIADFWLHPKCFWDEYNSMTAPKQLLQFLIYSLVFCAVLWIMTMGEMSSVNILHVVLLEIASLGVYIFIVWISIVCICPDNKKDSFAKCFISCCYVKFLIVPFEMIFLLLYHQTESVMYLGLALLVCLIAELYIFLSPIMSLNGLCFSKKVYYFLMVFLLLNVYDSFYLFGGIDFPQTDNFRDVLAEERFEQSQSLSTSFFIPRTVLTSKKTGKSFYQYSGPHEGVANNENITDDEYMEYLHNDMDSLKLICKSCKYIANRRFFQSLYQIQEKIVVAHSKKAYLKNPVIKEFVLLKDSVDDDHLHLRVFDNDIAQENDLLYDKEVNLREQYEKVMKVYYIAYLWHPVQWLFSYYKESEHTKI